MQWVVIEYIFGEAVEYVGPFADADSAYDYIDKCKAIPANESGREGYVRESKTWKARHLLKP